MIIRPDNFSISNATRISVGLLLIVLAAIGVSYTLDLLPSHEKERTLSNLELSKSLAIQFCAAVENGDINATRELAGDVLGTLPNLASIGLRRIDGQLAFASADHVAYWNAPASDNRQPKVRPIQVALFDHEKPWGYLELCFRADAASFRTGTMALLVFLSLSCLLGFIVFMKRTLRVLDPSQVIPERVRTLLDTLAEGAAIVDGDGRIILANQSFARLVDMTADRLLGTSLPSLAWRIPPNLLPKETLDDTSLPWNSLHRQLNCRGRLVQLQTRGGFRSMVVNGSSIQGARGNVRGHLFTFDDVTAVEQKNQQLVKMVDQLGQAQERVQKQNQELSRLATRDPLTECLNRRTFHEQAQTLFTLATGEEPPMSAIMVDIDHFKAVNDSHGHAKGDEVLREVAKRLASQMRASDVLCRFGGEEFCILLPATDLEGAHHLANELCRLISSKVTAELPITASFGVSCTSLGATNPAVLIEQADQTLYNAKRTGRNRASRFDQLDPSVLSRTENSEKPRTDVDEQIPVHAVRSLLSALSFRDPQTAEHSRRVSELCVKCGVAQLDSRELFILENAALLHDIGKVGVPDAVLLKPCPLTEEEWRIMRQHDRIGVEIIQTAFNSPQLAGIVANHHVWHETLPEKGHVDGDSVLIGARILAIADAYDAMVTARVYRAARSQREAFEELRNCAGTQFDPGLVEHFIGIVSRQTDADAAGERAGQLARVLRLSLEAERTVSALLSKDLEATAASAAHLARVARSVGSPKLANQCDKVIACVETAAEPQKLLQEAQGLLLMVNDNSDEPGDADDELYTG